MIGKFRPFNAFITLKLPCVYIKAEVIKSDITGMTAATNEDCIK